MTSSFWNNKFPQFLQKMQGLCMQADYLINRDEYCRGSRSCMGASIYGFGFPQAGYYGGFGGYENASASIYGSPYSGVYSSDVPIVPSAQERYQQCHSILDSIYNNTGSLSTASQSQTSTGSSQQTTPSLALYNQSETDPLNEDENNWSRIDQNIPMEEDDV